MSDVRAFRSIPNIPIVGQPVAIFDFRPIVVAQCACGRGKPFTLTHPTEVATCEGCDTPFGIAGIHFDRASGDCRVAVAKLTRVALPGAAATDD